MEAMMDDMFGDEPELNWNEKWYKKVLLLVYGLAVLILLFIAFTFAVALYLDGGKAELGYYEEDTHIEEKRGWWE